MINLPRTSQTHGPHHGAGEVYAGALSHADYNIGRLLDAVQESGQMDNRSALPNGYFPPKVANPGGVADDQWSSIVELPSGLVLNAQIVQNDSGRHNRLKAISTSVIKFGSYCHSLLICCGTPRRPPPRKSQATVALLEAALAHFVAGEDVSQWLLPKGPIRRPVRRKPEMVS